MHNFSHCQLQLEFEFGSANDKFMQVTVNDYQVTPQQPYLTLSVCLPTTVSLVLSNKGPNDTIVDSNGVIVQDCYIKLTSVSIDGFKLGEKFLNQKIILHTNDGKAVVSNYFGFNGCVTLDLAYNNVFAQYLYLNL